jgi:hypothetical protein
MVDEGLPRAIGGVAHVNEQDQVNHPMVASEWNHDRLADTACVLGDSLDLPNLDAISIPFDLSVNSPANGEVAILVH